MSMKCTTAASDWEYYQCSINRIWLTNMSELVWDYMSCILGHNERHSGAINVNSSKTPVVTQTHDDIKAYETKLWPLHNMFTSTHIATIKVILVHDWVVNSVTVDVPPTSDQMSQWDLSTGLVTVYIHNINSIVSVMNIITLPLTIEIAMLAKWQQKQVFKTIIEQSSRPLPLICLCHRHCDSKIVVGVIQRYTKSHVRATG